MPTLDKEGALNTSFIIQRVAPIAVFGNPPGCAVVLVADSGGAHLAVLQFVGGQANPASFSASTAI